LLTYMHVMVWDDMRDIDGQAYGIEG